MKCSLCNKELRLYTLSVTSNNNNNSHTVTNVFYLYACDCGEQAYIATSKLVAKWYWNQIQQNKMNRPYYKSNLTGWIVDK